MAGWDEAMASYRDRLNLLIAKLFAVRPSISTVDQEVLDAYLSYVHRHVHTLTRSFRFDKRLGEHDPRALPPHLATLFKTRTGAEEDDIRAALKTIRYVVDARDTLRLIVKARRLEMVRSKLFAAPVDD